MRYINIILENTETDLNNELIDLYLEKLHFDLNYFIQDNIDMFTTDNIITTYENIKTFSKTATLVFLTEMSLNSSDFDFYDLLEEVVRLSQRNSVRPTKLKSTRTIIGKDGKMRVVKQGIIRGTYQRLKTNFKRKRALAKAKSNYHSHFEKNRQLDRDKKQLEYKKRLEDNKKKNSVIGKTKSLVTDALGSGTKKVGKVIAKVGADKLGEKTAGAAGSMLASAATLGLGGNAGKAGGEWLYRKGKEFVKMQKVAYDTTQKLKAKS